MRQSLSSVNFLDGGELFFVRIPKGNLENTTGFQQEAVLSVHAKNVDLYILKQQ
jgi:hypothetical protein